MKNIKFEECFVPFSPQSFVCSRILFKNTKVAINKTIIQRFLFECEAWSLIIYAEERLKMFLEKRDKNIIIKERGS
jgi:hypothetical protein